MSIRARLERLDRQQRQHEGDAAGDLRLRARLQAAEARMRQAASDVGQLALYEARREHGRATVARDPAVIDARRKRDRSAEFLAILACGRTAAREDVGVV